EGARGQEISQKEELARKILAEANAGKDFAALARQYSEDEVTAAKGGDIGMVPVDSLHSELAEAVRGMKTGEVKGPVRTAAGLEILKLEAREEEKTLPFEEVSSAVMDTLRLQRAKIVAHAEAKKAFMELYEQKTLDLEGYAKARGLAVRKVGPFSEGQDAGVSMSPEALKKAFAFSAGELGDVVGTPEGYFIYVVEGKELSRIPDLKEIAQAVKADAAADASLKKAKEYARRLADAPADQLGAMNPSSTGEFTRSTRVVPKLSMIPKLMDDLDALSTPRTYEAGGAVYVVWLKSRKIADIGMLDEKKAQELRSGLLAAKREAALKSYLEQARDEKKGWHKVVIERDRIGGEDTGRPQNVPPPTDFN
ncbi:MAG TPA: peptidylprolyl isomerase, partial [Deltaproteobacteria bacterium]|nr:peptidylprolyl isomerase [Deltaproteobacteria bacterium]